MKIVLLIVIATIVVGYIFTLIKTNNSMQSGLIDSDLQMYDNCAKCAHAVEDTEKKEITCFYKNHPKPCKYHVEI